MGRVAMPDLSARHLSLSLLLERRRFDLKGAVWGDDLRAVGMSSISSAHDLPVAVGGGGRYVGGMRRGCTLSGCAAVLLETRVMTEEGAARCGAVPARGSLTLVVQERGQRQLCLFRSHGWGGVFGLVGLGCRRCCCRCRCRLVRV